MVGAATPSAPIQRLAQGSGHHDQASLVKRLVRQHVTIDQVILATRSVPSPGSGPSDLAVLVAARSAFWSVLADEQGRSVEVSVPDKPVEVALAPEDVEAMVDALIGNVFSHTDAGTPFGVSVGAVGERPWLEVSDQGPGFSSSHVAARGVSGGGSTGLGLDIVRRTAESVGGSMQLNDRPGGGAVVRVWLG